MGRSLLTVTLSLGVLVLVCAGAKAQNLSIENHNVNTPIEFSADRLEVRRDGKVAVFSGKVNATQGDLDLKADEVRVFYNENRAPGDGRRQNVTSAVSRIDTAGNVTVRTPREQAAGDWAIYDVPRRLMTLGGTVTLQRGDTVIMGNRLVIDFDSGFSRIESAGGKGRVEGSFTPQSRSNTP